MSDDIRVGLVRVDQIRFHPHNVRQDLGDLRPLSQSIAKYGVMQPVVVEKYGDCLRLRAGHRRVAAAQLAGEFRIPAVIHNHALPDREWIEHSIQENAQRAEMTIHDRRRAILALRQYGCSWDGIGETFGVSGRTVRAWALDEEHNGAKAEERKSNGSRGAEMSKARQRAVQRLISAHQEEFDRLLAEEGYVKPEQPSKPKPPGSRERLVQDVQELLSHGEIPETIARRLGRSLGAIDIALRRENRPDLARPFMAAAQRKQNRASKETAA
jgi:ParB/RepB/Spo0J family partition protein